MRENNVEEMKTGGLIGGVLVEGLNYCRNHTQKGTHGVGIQKMGICIGKEEGGSLRGKEIADSERDALKDILKKRDEGKKVENSNCESLIIIELSG